MCLARYDCALAWLLAKRPWIVPIPGKTKLHRLEENFGAVEVALSPGDLRELEEASARIEIHGARYPEIHERLTGRREPVPVTKKGY